MSFPTWAMAGVPCALHEPPALLHDGPGLPSVPNTLTPSPGAFPTPELPGHACLGHQQKGIGHIPSGVSPQSAPQWASQALSHTYTQGACTDTHVPPVCADT